MSGSPLIFVDLIEVKPKTFEQWGWHTGNRGSFNAESRYHAYLDNFQPWRLAIRSGDNQKPLFRSTERYFNRSDAIHAAELAFGSNSNVYLREAEQANRQLRLAVE